MSREPALRWILLIALAAVFLAQQLYVRHTAPAEAPVLLDPALVHVFVHADCPHCHKEIRFLNRLREQYPGLRIAEHDISRTQAENLLLAYAARRAIPLEELGTPLLVTGDDYLIGYHDDATTGAEIERRIAAFVKGMPATAGESTPLPENEKTVTLPLFGEINVFEISLPALAVLLGLVDGFNPCAMWVLVYLISLILGLQDRQRIVFLVGAFLLASGILYFLLMTAWLNVFLWLGYIRLLTTIIGFAALYMGITTIHAFIASGGQGVCAVGGAESRQRTMTQVQRLVAAPLNLATIAGIVVLAFTVNSIEFLCSSALPAIFTHVLTLAELPAAGYYGYILLYVLFFMLDDLVIFSAAAFAAERFAASQYAGYCQLIGGVILTALGLAMAFSPEILQSNV